MRDLEPYEDKPSKKPNPSPLQTYYQKKEQLEKRVQSNPQRDNLNICYICLVYFAKTSELIKTHLAGKQHQKN
jgi:hypothetical protein